MSREPELTAELVIGAYGVGAFPMARERHGSIEWFRPDPRAVLPLEASRFRVPRSLRKRVRSGRFLITADRAFDRVIRACARPRPQDDETWINDDMIRVYGQLHRAGVAHSVEAWVSQSHETRTPQPDRVPALIPGSESDPIDAEWELAGGLYGVALGGAFFGESMFSTVTDASKVCLVRLVDHLRERGFTLLDVQFVNPHLEQFGVTEIPHRQYLSRLESAIGSAVSW